MALDQNVHPTNARGTFASSINVPPFGLGLRRLRREPETFGRFEGCVRHGVIVEDEFGSKRSMVSQVGTVERAFELARSGTCTNVDDVRKALKREGFSNIPGHLEGPGIRRQLSVLIKAAASGQAVKTPEA